MRIFFLSLLLMVCVNSVNAQYTNMHWTFGDSCGIKFSATGIDSFYISSVTSRGTCFTVSDSLGELLFYGSSARKNLWLTGYGAVGVIHNKNHQIMQNGDSLKTSNWYREMQCIPNPGHPGQFILFQAGVTTTTNPGLRYSIVDLNMNNGLGAVTQKNILIDANPIADGLFAVQHGNGRDWWLFYKVWAQGRTNEIWKILIDPTGLSAIAMQNIGVSIDAGFYRYVLNPAKDELMGVCRGGILEKFDLDRCSGVLSNAITIRNSPPPATLDPQEAFWEGDYSPSGQFFYVSTGGQATDTNFLYQLDLNSNNIWNNRVVIDTITYPPDAGSAIRRAPDGRIYRAIAWNDGMNYHYPYPDTTYNLYNTHLSVINYPDSAGTTCDYQPFSVYLPNCRTYLGLPANVDFNKGRLTGSICDTLGTVSVNEPEEWKGLSIYPNPCYNKLGFNLPVGITLSEIRIQDVSGRLLNEFHYSPDDFIREINVEKLNPGVYVISFISANQSYSLRFVKL
jgi:hypothetical protein